MVLLVMACAVVWLGVGLTNPDAVGTIVFVGIVSVGGMIGLTLVVAAVNFARNRLREAQERRADIERRSILSMTRNLYSLSPTEFEEYCEILLAKRGYQVERVGGAGDHGIDLWLDDGDGDVAVVQCKRYHPDRVIGPRVVRELRGTMSREGVNHAYLVTTSRFSPGAHEEASAVDGQIIHLVDGDQLARAARRTGLPGTVMKF
jgi:restriction endonuclease Mrr